MGNTPLHIAAIEGNLAAAITICTKSPNSAKIEVCLFFPKKLRIPCLSFLSLSRIYDFYLIIQCYDGFLPLHSAVSVGAQHPDAPQITTMLLQTFEDATSETNEEGLLPIHLASMSGFTAGIRTLLSSKFDIISSRENTEMMLPLDLAIEGFREENSSDSTPASQMIEADDSSNHNQNKNYKSSIDLLLASTLYNRMIAIPHNAGDDHPFLPLHGAMKACPTLESWKAISLLYCNHAMDTDINGCTAAHVLCSLDSDNAEKDILMLETLHQDNFSTFDNDGLLPLHRALLNSNTPFNFVKAIINKRNCAITEQVRSKHGTSAFEDLLPVQLAALHSCDLDIIFELFRNTQAFFQK